MHAKFVVSEASKSVFKAAGLHAASSVAGPWPLQAGDVISFPEAPLLFWRVLSRVHVVRAEQEKSEWLLLLEQAADPFAALDAPA